MAAKIAPMQPCIVTWEDAVHNAGEQHESVAAGLASYKPYFRRSIGFYVGRTKEVEGRSFVVLCTDDDRSTDSPDAVGGLFFVPAAMVVKIEPAIAPKRK